MISALKNLPPNVVESTLTSIVRSLTPQPIPAESRQEFSSLETSVLRELETKARISSTDRVEEAQKKILDVIVKELSQPVLVGTRAEEAKRRLGERGDLRPDLYKVVFGDNFSENEKRGVKRAHVEQALRHPDMVQHLLPGRVKSGDYPGLSLYAKIIGELNSRNVFTLLIQTQRDADTQRVGPVWRVYHTDVDLKKSVSPLDQLRAFIDVYGFDVSVGGGPPTKFVLYEVFPSEAANSPDVSVLKVHVTGTERWASGLLFRLSPLGMIEVAIAYAINITKYEEDLRKHGAQVT